MRARTAINFRKKNGVILQMIISISFRFFSSLARFLVLFFSFHKKSSGTHTHKQKEEKNFIVLSFFSPHHTDHMVMNHRNIIVATKKEVTQCIDLCFLRL